MTTTDTDHIHIYTPADNSLEERARAYREVRSAWLNVEASLKNFDGDDWADVLGDREEVMEAYKITERSMSMATKGIRKDELKVAQKQGLLSADDVTEIIQDKRVQEMMELRKADQNSNSHKNSRNQ